MAKPKFLSTTVIIFACLIISLLASAIVNMASGWNNYEFLVANRALMLSFYGFQFVSSTVLVVLLLRKELLAESPRIVMVVGTLLLWFAAVLNNFASMLSRLFFSIISIPNATANKSVVGLTALIYILGCAILVVYTKRNNKDKNLTQGIVFATTLWTVLYMLYSYLTRIFTVYQLSYGYIGYSVSAFIYPIPYLQFINDAIPGLLLVFMALVACYLYTRDSFYWSMALVVLAIDAFFTDLFGFALLNTFVSVYLTFVYMAIQAAAFIWLYTLRSKEQPVPTGIKSLKISALLLMQLGFLLPAIANDALWGIFPPLALGLGCLAVVVTLFSVYRQQPGFSRLLQIVVLADGLVVLALTVLSLVQVGMLRRYGGYASLVNYDLPGFLGNMQFKSLPVANLVVIGACLVLGLVLCSMVVSRRKESPFYIGLVYAIAGTCLFIASAHCLMEVFPGIILSLLIFVSGLFCLSSGLTFRQRFMWIYGLSILGLAVLKLLTYDNVLLDLVYYFGINSVLS